jgi:hypothetical protein
VDAKPDNMILYNAVRKTPAEALKPIRGGRLVGMSDINPMWRIKVLTEQFGICGFGWKYTIDRQWLEPSGLGEIAAFTNITLYLNTGNGWSEGIAGTGGSMYVEKESKGLHVNDECFKMSLTDAISVASKALGIAADVYWDSDKTKYTKPVETSETGNIVYDHGTAVVDTISPSQAKRLFAIANSNAEVVKKVVVKYGYEHTKDIRKADYDKICGEIEEEVSNNA